MPTPTAADLDFAGARLKHYRFKSKLRAILYGGDSDRALLLDRHRCVLGQWINSILLPSFGHLPQVRALDTIHTELHELARQLLAQHDAGNVQEAHRRIAFVDSEGERLLALLTEVERLIAPGPEADLAA